MRYVESLNTAHHRLMKDDDRVLVLGEDIVDPYGGAFKVTKGLSTNFPGRVIATPISEAAITGFAIGLAINGFKPILEVMFGDFITLCADQIINGASKFHWMYGEQIEVPLVIRSPMGGYNGFGPTHSQTLESLFLGVPGIKIIAPSCYHDPGDLLYKTVLSNNNSPTLFIENKTLYPEKLTRLAVEGKIGEFYFNEYSKSRSDFPTISLKIEREKPEVTLISYGGISLLAVRAALSLFLEEEILVEVLIPSLIKPIPLHDFLESVKTTGKIVIVEEGVKTGGWGAELGSSITEKAYSYLNKPVFRIGAKDFPIPSSKYFEKIILPQQKDIEKAIKTLIK